MLDSSHDQLSLELNNRWPILKISNEYEWRSGLAKRTKDRYVDAY